MGAFLQPQNRKAGVYDYAGAGSEWPGAPSAGGCANWLRRPASPQTRSARLENNFGAIVETLVRIQDALEKAGIVFIPADQAGGPGVRFASAFQQAQAKTITLRTIIAEKRPACAPAPARQIAENAGEDRVWSQTKS